MIVSLDLRSLRGGSSMASPAPRAHIFSDTIVHPPSCVSCSRAGPQPGSRTTTSDGFASNTSTEKMAQFGTPSLDEEAGTGSDMTATFTLARGAVGAFVSLQPTTKAQATSHAAMGRVDVRARRIEVSSVDVPSIRLTIGKTP